MNNQLLNEMEAAGLAPAQPLLDTMSGELQRYQVATDKNGTRNGWLVSYYNSSAPTVHVFGSWKAGASHTVVEGDRSKINKQTRQLIEQAQRQAKLRKAEKQRDIAEQCAEFWESLPCAEVHPYLTAKGIKAHIARRSNNVLVIPLVDFNLCLTSLQFIDQCGVKTFRKGGRVSGSFCPLGSFDLSRFNTWVVCEGFATGATIHEATGLPVLVSFNANNLKTVAAMLRMRAPAAQIIIAADNDRFTSVGNVGVQKAEAAARDAEAYVVIPQFDINEGTDFNDLAQQKGLQVISQVFKEIAA